MAARNGIVLTTKQIAAWRDEDASLECKINELIQRRNELKRKLDAVDILSVSTNEKEPTEETLTSESKEDGDSAAFDLVENLRKTGDSLKVQQARQRLIELGHEDKANQKNYIYGLLYRLVKSQKLAKRGKRYRAAPNSSSKEETEAVGASARH
jgi:hypothetical protein